jgi:hypothetical protein
MGVGVSGTSGLCLPRSAATGRQARTLTHTRMHSHMHTHLRGQAGGRGGRCCRYSIYLLYWYKSTSADEREEVVQREKTGFRWSQRLKSRDIATVRVKRLASVQVGKRPASRS